MNFLRDPSPNIQFEAFHVFKVFVANPKKPSEICSILYQNKTKLIPFLEAFQTDKGDEQFHDEKKLLIDTLKALERPLSGRITASNSGNALTVADITPIRESFRDSLRVEKSSGSGSVGEKVSQAVVVAATLTPTPTPTVTATVNETLNNRDFTDIAGDLKHRIKDVSMIEAMQQQQQQPRAALIIASSSYLVDAHTLSTHSSASTLPSPSLSSQL